MSSGVGLSTAVTAARHGFTTVATLRDTTRDGALRAAAEAAGVELDIRRLDVVDEASVAACVDGVVADHGSLDILVNNAGRGFVGTVEQMPPDEVRASMEVNFFGVVATTRAAMPHLRASGGRVITVTSVGVQVIVVEPGPVSTEFINDVGVDVARTFAEAGVYEPAMQAHFDHVMAEFADPGAAQTGDQVAETILTAMVSDSPAFRHQTSHWSRTFCGTELSDHDGSAVVGMTTDWLRAV